MPITEIHKEKGFEYIVDYFDVDSFDNLEYEKCRQTYGVCFYENEIVIGLNSKKKTWSFIGGGIEKDETFEQTLRREIQEESNMEVLKFLPIGYQKVTDSRDSSFIYQLRYVCSVRPFGPFISDPVGSIVEIKLVNPKEYKQYIDWGKIGDRIMQRALEMKYILDTGLTPVPDAFSYHLKNCHTSLFRFEGLQDYSAEDGDQEIQEFINTGKLSRVPNDTNEWWRMIKDMNKKGIVTERVRLVTEPQTDYSKWELAYLKEAKKYSGDDIRIVEEDDFIRVAPQGLKDFWLIDNLYVFVMEYRPKGKYVGSKMIDGEGVSEYVKMKQKLLEVSRGI